MPLTKENDIYAIIGLRIRTCRILRGMDQKRLAKTIGISPYRLNRYESGGSQIPPQPSTTSQRNLVLHSDVSLMGWSGDGHLEIYQEGMLIPPNKPIIATVPSFAISSKFETAVFCNVLFLEFPNKTMNPANAQFNRVMHTTAENTSWNGVISNSTNSESQYDAIYLTYY